MDTSTLPIVKVVNRNLTYFGRRVRTTTTHFDKSPMGLREISTHYIDDADPRNGDWKAGDVTIRLIKGDGRVVVESDPKFMVTLVAERLA